jgi:hypothetical protein
MVQVASAKELSEMPNSIEIATIAADPGAAAGVALGGVSLCHFVTISLGEEQCFLVLTGAGA